jgi:hypothetical protein
MVAVRMLLPSKQPWRERRGENKNEWIWIRVDWQVFFWETMTLKFLGSFVTWLKPRTFASWRLESGYHYHISTLSLLLGAFLYLSLLAFTPAHSLHHDNLLTSYSGDNHARSLPTLELNPDVKSSSSPSSSLLLRIEANSGEFKNISLNTCGPKK